MPSFQISDGPTTVEVKGDGNPQSTAPRTGSIQFTVTNTGTEAREANFDVLPGLPVRKQDTDAPPTEPPPPGTKNAESKWFMIDGAVDRVVQGGQTETAAISISVPPDVAKGDYLFHLLVSRVDKDIDYDFTQSPAIILRVSDAPVKPKWLWWLLGALALLLVLGAGAYFFFQEDEAPNLVNKTVAEARTEAKGYKLEATPAPATTGKAKDTIISQVPAAGAEIEKGDTIKVVFDPGPAPSVAPALVGKTVDDARSLASNFDFTPVPAAAPTGIEPNTIITQSPAAGQPIVAGSPLKVVYDPGVIVPVMSNVGMDTDRAIELLRPLQLFVQSSTGQCETSGRDGEVIGQSIQPGTTKASGTGIGVTVRRLRRFCPDRFIDRRIFERPANLHMINR